ncbi:hypothetical protein [Oleiharenicola sp. Vm1]|uniref:hypothetical protein n=1 Tax=Oleiharenicola sp. Vm1 TaxID=3398393 RepID=UPI0039F59C81
MITLPVILPHRRLALAEDGSVLDSATQQNVGVWSADALSPDQENFLTVQDGAHTFLVRARYAFTTANQLTVSLSPQDGTVAQASSATFNGYIEIDDQHDVIYWLLKQAPTAANDGTTGQGFTVYGDLQFASPTQLQVTLAGQGPKVTTVITADPAQPLVPAKNADITRAGLDLLTFHASTQNNFAGAAAPQAAKIAFAGQWDLIPTGLAFNCSASGDLKNPDLTLSLKGACKAVAAGLEFRLNNGDASALFTVAGQHRFDSGSATWSIVVGYTQQANAAAQVKASAKANFKHQSAGGNQLTLTGDLSFTSAGGQSTLALEIQAEYTFKGGQIVFKATANVAGGRLSYDLHLGGQIKVGNGTLTFSVDYGSGNVRSLAVTYQGSDADFLRNFSVEIKTDSAGKVTASVAFTLSVTYVGNVQVVKRTA